MLVKCCGILKEKKKIDVKIATVMTDFHMHPQWTTHDECIDYFFVSNVNVKNQMIEKGIDGFKIFVTGIPISNRFSEKFDRHVIFEELNLNENIFTVLFFAGGALGIRKRNYC